MTTVELTHPTPRELIRSRVIAWPLSASILGRLPIAALGLVLLLHTRALGGSYALAGSVAGALGLGLAVGGPLLGRLADRRGAPAVLLGATAASAVAMIALAALPRGISPVVLLMLAALVGLVQPPVGGIVRSAWPRLLPPAVLERVYAVESSALELTYIAGPALLGGVIAARSSRLALLASAVLLGLGAAALLASRPLRRVTTRRHPRDEVHRLGALVSPGVVVLTLAFVGLAVTLGAVEVAVAATAGRAGHPGEAGLLLAVWGLGSLIGGAWMVQRPPQGDPARRLVFLAVASAALHGALVLVAPAGSVALGLALLVAGAVVAPAFATAYGMTSRIAPAGTATEAFSWLSTGIAVGIAAGSALAGALADGPGPRLAFAVGAAAPLLSAALVWLRRRDLCRAG